MSEWDRLIRAELAAEAAEFDVDAGAAWSRLAAARRRLAFPRLSAALVAAVVVLAGLSLPAVLGPGERPAASIRMPALSGAGFVVVGQTALLTARQLPMDDGGTVWFVVVPGGGAASSGRALTVAHAIVRRGAAVTRWQVPRSFPIGSAALYVMSTDRVWARVLFFVK